MSIDHDVPPGLVAELDALDPDEGLVAALEQLSPTLLAGEALAAYVRGSARVLNRSTARLLDGLHHLGRAREGTTDRLGQIDEFSADELCGVLGWSRQMAARKLDLADDLAVRLPEVADAVWEGRLEESKARALVEWTRDLAEDHAHQVCREVLPEAPDIPVGEVISRIEAVARALDPQWWERRRQRALKSARVILSANPTGTATYSAADISAPAGLAMRDRVDALTAAIRGLGVLLPVGELRVQVFARLLDGSMAGVDDRQVALTLAAEYHAAANPDDEPNDDEPNDGGPDDSGPDDFGPDDSGPDGGAEPDGDTSDLAPDASSGAAPGPSEALGPPDVLDPAASSGFPEMIDGGDPGPGRLRTGTSELRLRLTTAVGLDQYPGHVPGYGTVGAPDARALLRHHVRGEWRVVLTTDDGHLEHVLLARRRPTGPRDHTDRSRGASGSAIVELQVPTTLLVALTPAEHGPWAPLLAELQTRLVEARLGPGFGLAPDAHDPGGFWLRRPRAEVDRWTRVRDRHCVAPCCRRPAHRAELDHTVAWSLGGPTSSWNLGVWDRHHHRAKHRAGWRVRQVRPGRFVITTRAGVRHVTAPRPVLQPLPAPRPPAWPRPLPDDGSGGAGEDADWRERYLARTAPKKKPGPAPRATPVPTVDADDPPPF